MCLAIPGEILSVRKHNTPWPEATVSFGGLKQNIGLALLPSATVGSFVLVHAGFAIALVDRVRAEETLANLRILEP